MLNLLILATGGVIGTLLRYVVGEMIGNRFHASFPLATFVVNLTGSLAIGFLAAFFQQSTYADTLKLFIFTGILASYTTFSSFALETFTLLKRKAMHLSIINLLGTNLLGLVFVCLGFLACKMLFLRQT